MNTLTHIYCLLFDNYETLDLMGAVEFLYRIPNSQLHYVSYGGGAIRSRQGFDVLTEPLIPLLPESILLVVGGQGTRQLVQQTEFLNQLKQSVQQEKICLSVCTGSALLAAAGCLNGIKATSNKRAFAWVCSLNHQVHWQAVARWVRDDKFYTSSGVLAGMDMTLGFIADHYGEALAKEIAQHTEYRWQNCPEYDEFAIQAA